MDSNFKQDIVKAVSLIPGIKGFASIDFNHQPRKLSEKNFLKAISYEQTTKGVLVKIAVIIDLKINSKTISNEIISSINNIFKVKRIKLDDVLIYIRGVN